MKIKRREFNNILAGTAISTLIPHNSYADKYTGPVNWAGISFLLPNNEIENLMPITKVASELKSDIDNASFFNSYLNKSLKENPLLDVNLKLKGFAENAKLALTYGFSAEFDFGEFKDEDEKKTAYLMYSFGQCLLYNPYDRMIISSTPIRGILTNLISYEEQKNYSNIKAELMKRAFFDPMLPDKTMVKQFRNMLAKQSFDKKKWDGRKPRVVSVNFPMKKKDKLITNNKNFGLSFKNFIDFLGQSSTSAFGYKLNSPIMPYMLNQALTAGTISRFDFATQLYNSIDVKFPKSDISINIYHKGWRFKEKILQKPNLQVTLGMGLQIEIIDDFNNERYNQYFFAEKRFIENFNKTMRSDAATVCELTEGLLERAFKSIASLQYRTKLISGEAIDLGGGMSVYFRLNTKKSDPNYVEEVHRQSKAILKLLPQHDVF